MPGHEQVHALMTEIGPALELAEVLEHPESHTWTLADQDGIVLFAELLPDEGVLFLSAEAGTPQPDDRARLYPLMLQYNARWQETGGVRLALDGPEGAVVQAYALPVTDLDLARLCTVIRNFRATLGGWRTIVAGPGSAGAEPNEASDMSMRGMIRG
jgi:hypothetical protein